MEHTLLFTGHMIDKKDRSSARFPPENEMKVRKEIERRIGKLKKDLHNKNLRGIAGGACGGDILFHEVCQGIDIPTEMYLALPPDEFKKQSVSFANEDWDERFDRLHDTLPVHILPEAPMQEGNEVWGRANLWMLTNALKHGGENLTIIALWDRKGGDGSGGTEHMINAASARDAQIEIIDIHKSSDIMGNSPLSK